MNTTSFDSLAFYVDVNTELLINAKPELLGGSDAINNSILNILNCSIGSRPFQRDYGSRLLHFIQEPVDRVTATKIEISLIQSIERWEPRITLNRQSTSVVPYDDRTGYNVTISYEEKIGKRLGSINLSVKK